MEKKYCAELHELISFFESEPKIECPDGMEWPNQSAEFHSVFGDDEIECFLWPIEYFVSLVWKKKGQECFNGRFRMIYDIKVENRLENQLLIVRFVSASHLDHLIIRLRPHVQVTISTKEH